MQRDTGDILSTDARNHGVTAFQLAVEDQLSQEHRANSVAGAIGAHVNRVFDRETISISGAELRCVTKAYDIALELRDQIRQTAIQNGLPPSIHLRLIRRSGFECRCARRDEVAIDRSDIRHVCRCRGTNHAFRHAGTAVQRVGGGNYAQVLAWYRKSAVQGFAPAQNQLGSMYESNIGLPQNYKRAVAYYRLAANQGYALAQYNLAAMFEDGRGVHRDYKQALIWYRKAADQNLSSAEKQVGYFYQCGFGVTRDFAQAMAWYRRAAGHGNADAENQLGYMAGEGWGQPQDYSVALSWYYKAAEHGSNQAMEKIGYIFQHGTGVRTDYAQAMFWFNKAAAQGNGDAENQLGWMFQFGQGVRTDNARALTWYGLADDLGNVKGKNNLQALTDDLQDDSGEWQNATLPVSDAAIVQAQRWAKIRDLHRSIDAAEAKALYQDDYADQLEHIGHGKSAAMANAFNAMGSVGAVQHRTEAEKYRAEAVRLHDELARVGSQSQSAAGVPAP